MMDDPLAGFLQSLMTDGRARVEARPLGRGADGEGQVSNEVLVLLERLDGQARAESGLDCPAFLPPPAQWAARILYHLCQFTVCRDIGAAQIQEICSEACLEARGPNTDWSVDLLFRQLPRLYRAAAHLSPSDPLLVELRRIAAAWPLSSVGIPDLGALSIESFIGHPALQRLYADRIAEAGDVSRLGEARVDAALRADLGLHPELAPELARRLSGAAKGPRVRARF